MKKLLFILLMPLLLFSQGENDNWYFGRGAAVNFAGTTPISINTSAMGGPTFVNETCGSISDSNGNLLFYTDGLKVWNRENQVMDNGNGLNGHNSTEQLVIVKSLKNPNQYYIFIGGENHPGNNKQITYSIVDMSLGGLDANGYPLGRVIDNEKNVLVVDNIGNGFFSEAITVVPSSYGTMWVLIPNDLHLYAYSISNTGFNNGNPVISNLNFPFSLFSAWFGVKASPKLNNIELNFSHYICLSMWSGPGDDYVNKVYSFNYQTGHITNDFDLQINSLGSYSPEFNQDASILYLGKENLYAVDMLSATPTNINYMQFASSSHSFGAIQRNKYGEVYLSYINHPYLSKIINPDVYGANISFDQNNFFLGTNVSGAPMQTVLGLPQLIEKPYKATIGNCISNIILDVPEVNINYTYQANNTIITEDNYLISPDQDITMKAGNSITLLPNTNIKKGCTYLAKIEDCKIVEAKSNERKKYQPKISLSIDLDKSVRPNEIRITPNPATNLISIDTKNSLIYWDLSDMSGKRILTGKNNRINIEGISQGMYLLLIKTDKETITKKIIKK